MHAAARFARSGIAGPRFEEADGTSLVRFAVSALSVIASMASISAGPCDG
jgi:hypothetical protein